MDQNLEKQLVALAPIFYREYNLSPFQSCMGRGFECGDGWFIPMKTFSIEMEKINKQLKLYKHRIVCDQFKEKWGEVTCYTHIEKIRPINYLFNTCKYPYTYFFKKVNCPLIRIRKHSILIEMCHRIYNLFAVIINVGKQWINKLIDLYCTYFIKDLDEQTFKQYHEQKVQLINNLVDQCYDMCENCGSTDNIITTTGWIRRICNNCAHKKDEENEKC